MEVSGCCRGGVGVVVKLGLERGRAFVRVGLGCPLPVGIGLRLVDFGLESVRAVAVLGGFGGGDVDERLEVGGIGGGLVGVLLELPPQGFDLAGAVGRGGFGCQRTVAVLRGFGGGDVDMRLKVGGGSRGRLRVLVKLGLERGRAFVRVGLGCPLPVGIGLRLVDFGLESVRAVAVLGGLGGGDVNECLEVGGGGRGGVGVLLQLSFEFSGALPGLLGAGVGFVAFRLGPVGPVAMLGGFGRGDVDERLEVGGVGGGLSGVLFELLSERFEFAGAVGCGGFGGGGAVAVLRGFGGERSMRAWRSAAAVAAATVCCCSWTSSSSAALPALLGARVGFVALRLGPVGTVAMLGGFSGGDVDKRLEIGGVGGGLSGSVFELLLERFEFASAVGCRGFGGGFGVGGVLAGLLGVGASSVEVGLEPLGPVTVLRRLSG